MTMAPNAKVEDYDVYRLPVDAAPDDIGEMPSSEIANMDKLGSITGRVTTGDSLEPDVLGTNKSFGVDVTSMWIGFFDPPEGFEVESGDWLFNPLDTTRKFEVQYIDRRPGGVENHHYEMRLQTTEIERG